NGFTHFLNIVSGQGWNGWTRAGRCSSGRAFTNLTARNQANTERKRQDYKSCQNSSDSQAPPRRRLLRNRSCPLWRAIRLNWHILSILHDAAPFTFLAYRFTILHRPLRLSLATRDGIIERRFVVYHEGYSYTQR